VLVHRPEWEFASTRLGRSRYQPSLWPDGLTPELYDLEDEPYGPFPRSRAITGDGAVRLVGLPGHSIGQVGVVVELAGTRLVFCADHVLRADWFAEDVAAGRLVGLGMFHRDLAIETSRRLYALTSEPRTFLLPSHDSTVPARLAAATAEARAANMTPVTS
jgi:glyoxylase-like metal-dependent hydrolase (beta-lactamase superfamily II)